MLTTNLNGKTPDIAEENIKKLKQIFPDVFAEGKIDFDKLKQILGEYTEDSNERYNFSWNGKGRALRLSQTPSLATLRPCKEESKDWDTTQNLYIEGDNLEVLKLLQKSYHSKIKMIYIDPPYNKGKDFVYPDDFHDSLENYKKITGQVDSEGNRIGTNTEASGRYHTDWLNMIYPRLRIARNLLTDDGVIFISIDDKEVDNLKKICNEVFGEDNFVGNITWEKRTKCQNTSTARELLQSKVEYILVYKKFIDKMYFNLEVTGTKEYEELDNSGPYREKFVEEMSALGMRGRDTMIFPILGISPKEGNQWKIGIDQIKYFSERGDLFLKDGKPTIKIRPQDEDSEIFKPFWSHFFDKEAYGTAEIGKSELSGILNTKEHGFETVKPLSLIKNLALHIKLGLNADDIILDFFSGSATTAHAVMQLNAEDRGNRKFIMVQLPEPIDEKYESYKAGYKNICEIGKERIRRAGDKIKQEKGLDAQNLDIGFKVLKLDTSNIRKWQPDYEDLEQTLLDHIDNYVDGRTELDVVYEIMLKYGLDLTYPVDEFTVAQKKVYSIGFGMLMICLDNEITTEVAKGILAQVKELAPESTRVVFKDNGFKTDSNKTNIKEILKCGGIEEFITL